MNILYFAQVDLQTPMGARTHTLEILRALDDAGHRVDAILPGPCPISLGPRVQVHWIPPPKKTLSSLMASYGWAWLCVWRLSRRRRYHLYYEREAPLEPLMWLLVRYLKLPCVIEINGLVTQELQAQGASWRGLALASILQRWKCRNASLLVCGASGWVDFLRSKYRLPAHRAVFIPNGAFEEPFENLDRGAARQALGLPSTAFVVGFVGSFHHYADVESVIQAIHQARAVDPRIVGYLVGAGAKLAACQQLVERLGDTGITLVGPVAAQEIPRTMAAMDCAVAPMSRPWLEQMQCWHGTTKVAEYLVSGLPIIAFDVPGSASRPVMQAVALTVEPGDIQGTAAAIVRLAQDPKLHQQMAASARRMGRQERSWQHTLDGIMERLNMTEKQA